MNQEKFQEVNTIELAKHLFEKLNEQLIKEGRTLADLRTEKKKWFVAWRTMHHLSKGELVLRPKRISDLCKRLGISFGHEVKYFIKK
jgi:hypothetical protein